MIFKHFFIVEVYYIFEAYSSTLNTGKLVPFIKTVSLKIAQTTNIQLAHVNLNHTSHRGLILLKQKNNSYPAKVTLKLP